MNNIKKIGIINSIKTKFEKFISWFLILSSIVSGIATYIAMAPSGDSNRYLVLILLNIDLVLLVTLVILVTRNLVKLWSRKKSKQLGTQLQTRIVVIFSFLAAVPAVIVAIFGAIFFTVGIENWFSSRVESALNKSVSVANAYLIQGQEQIRLEGNDVATIINGSGFIYNDVFALDKLLDRLAHERKLTEIIVFNKNGKIVAKNHLAFLFKDPSRNKMFKLSQESRDFVINYSDSESQKLVSAMLPIDNLFSYFLYISKFKDIKVVSDINVVKKAVYEYRAVENQREGLHITFTMIFIVVALLLMLVAIFIGINFANGIITPMNSLANAAERVSSGDLNVRVPDLNKKDEISNFSKIFNTMTEQLSNQRSDLLSVNTQLESRTRFTETVLSGVTAGVIGIDKNEKIFLPNKSAMELLHFNLEDTVGKNITKILPEISDLLKEAKNHPDKVTKGQVEIVKNDKKIILMTQITVEKNNNKIFGYVITFDDMTELLQAQRVAAWSDVARRIAHEIKNPLTPILLAADRLKKKYSDHIDYEPNVFFSYINTIIRQVENMRNMVNEFSSFARMPAPILEKTNLNELVNGLGSLSILSRDDIIVNINVPEKTLYAKVDENQIRQALLNLISNAIHSIDIYTENYDNNMNKKRLRIKLTNKSNVFYISVSDSGIGLPNAEIKNLTEPYVTSKQDGTGLGLAIVQKIMEDHKGSLFLDNLESKNGAIATISFPSSLN